MTDDPQLAVRFQLGGRKGEWFESRVEQQKIRHVLQLQPSEEHERKSHCLRELQSKEVFRHNWQESEETLWKQIED